MITLQSTMIDSSFPYHHIHALFLHFTEPPIRIIIFKKTERLKGIIPQEYYQDRRRWTHDQLCVSCACRPTSQSAGLSGTFLRFSCRSHTFAFTCVSLRRGFSAWPKFITGLISKQPAPDCLFGGALECPKTNLKDNNFQYLQFLFFFSFHFNTTIQ